MTTSELLKQAYEMIRDLKKQALDHPKGEEIAVVGMGCRFPGGCDTPEAYWNFLRDGRDAAIEVPPDRWDINEYYDPVHGVPGKMYIRKANFLQRDVGEFDARFFRISPTEANEMDPQQRQLLEVSWEALENAGQNPAELSGSRTGVFIGINSTNEYAMIPRDESSMNQYHGTGTTSSIASGRIAYVFGFNGPTLSVDTACSSSLVSALLAVDALRNGSCDLALAGGVNLLLSPLSMAALCMMNALSSNGRSAPFDESADGYGRGEGCGILVLKRLSDAQRDGDRIYAVICGGAINNDGASSGLTVPNGNAQRMVVQDALKNCALQPEDISYLETHGTGTALGDPIEVKAITEVFGNRGRKEPLVLGAVKGNIGHLESAAGVAGLIKVILSLYHQEMAPVCNFEVQNPRVDFSKIPAVLPQGSRPWKKIGKKDRIAGISSFGFSGTNAHVILKEAPPAKEPEASTEAGSLQALCLSAKERPALQRLLKAYDAYLDEAQDTPIADICFTANTTRPQFPYRCAVTGTSRQAIRDELQKKLAEMDEHPDWPAQITTNPKFAYLFSDALPGAQNGLRKHPGFEKRYLEFADTAEAVLGHDAAEAIRDEKPEQTKAGEGLLALAAACAAVRWMEDMGFKAEIVSGARLGMFPAAVSAGILSLDAAIRLYGRENGLLHGNQPVQTERPRCRYVSAKAGSVLQNVTENDLLSDLRLAESEEKSVCPYLYQEGYRYFISFGRDTKADAFDWKDAVRLSMLNGNEEETARTLAACFAEGTPVNWKPYYRKDAVRKAVLPNYPFAKNRYWCEVAKETEEASGGAVSKRGLDGAFLNLPGKEKQVEYIFTLDNFRELRDNNGVVHLGYYMEMLHGNVSQLYPETAWKIQQMDFSSPILVMDQEKKQVMLTLEEAGEELLFTFHSKNMEDKGWQKNVSGRIVPNKEPEAAAQPDAAWKKGAVETGDDFYALLESRGLSFGKAVRWVESISRSGKAAKASFRPMEDGEDQGSLPFHPGIVDSCAQICNYLAPVSGEEANRYMISSLTDIVLHPGFSTEGLEARVLLTETRKKKDELVCEIHLNNGAGQRLLLIREAHLKRFDEELILRMTQAQNALAQGGSADHGFLMRYSEMPPAEQQTALAEYVRTLIADVLGMKPEEIGLDDKVDEMGLDSMSGMIFYTKLTQSLGAEINFMDMMESGTCRGTAAMLMPYLPGGGKYRQENAGDQRTPYDADLSVPHWIYDYHEKPKARMRLFCFPYGFGSASMYKEWQEMLGEKVDVCAIKIPGLDAERFREMPAGDIDELMETMDKVIGDTLLDKPCATFGNSWGSLFSYRLANRLSRDPRANLKACFISGYTSPSLPNTSLMQILDELKRIGYDHIPTDQELRETNSLDEISRAFVSAWGQSVRSEDNAVAGTKLTLSLIASAYRLIENFHYDPKEKFTVPIVGFHGIDDYRVPLEDMNAWENVTSGGYTMFTVPGDHAFIEKDQSEARVIELLKQEIGKRFQL